MNYGLWVEKFNGCGEVIWVLESCDTKTQQLAEFQGTGTYTLDSESNPTKIDFVNEAENKSAATIITLNESELRYTTNQVDVESIRGNLGTITTDISTDNHFTR